MIYKELADLIFPNAKEISYYEEKYPRRNLKEGAVVIRVAPSPTGNVHIGTIYQALINKKVAKQTGGVFYTRIEDTDQKREIEGGINQIIQSLKDFDLEPDEGMINENEWKHIQEIVINAKQLDSYVPYKDLIYTKYFKDYE